MEANGIREPVDTLIRFLSQIADQAYGANMLDRVAYGLYRPTRLAELQVSIT